MQRLNRVTKVIAPVQKTKGVRSASTAQVPLYEPLPGFDSKTADIPLITPEFKTSTLSNGVKVVTVSNKQPISSVGLFINAGSRNETPENAGAAFLLKHLGFKSSKKLSPLRLVRTIELLNANYTIACGREHMMYYSEIPTDNVAELVPVLSEALHPALKEYEVRDERETVKEAVQEIESNPRSVILELLHQEAYRNKGLGNTLYSPVYNLHNLTPESLAKFVDSQYTANNVVLLGTGGVEHDDLVKMAEKTFNFGSRSAAQKQSSAYVGGEVRVAGDFETHFGLAFEGAKVNSADQHALGVLQYVLGNGSARTTDGPGKGAASRLNRNVVEPNGTWLFEASTFNFNYSDSGLFGVLAVAKQGNVPRVSELITKELLRVTSGVNAEELARARNLYKADVLFNTEGRVGLLEFLAAKSTTPEKFAQAVDAVTADQVVAAAKRVLKSKPTLAVLGDIQNTPTLEQIQSTLKF